MVNKFQVVIRTLDTLELTKVDIQSLREAINAVLSITQQGFFGSRGWYGETPLKTMYPGDIYCNSKVIAHISYNGRAWLGTGYGMYSLARQEIVDYNTPLEVIASSINDTKYKK